MAARYEIKPGGKDQFMFNLKAGNNEIILTSELYKAKKDCENGIESVRKNSQDDKRFTKKTAADGQFYFVLTAGNSKTIGKSEMYKTEAAREKGIASVKKNGPAAKVVEVAAAAG